MSEADAVAAVDEPVTVDSLTEDLRALGVRPGETLLVHSSLRALGWVAGGAQAVVDALRRAVGEAGTVVVPTFTGQYGDPAEWNNPPVPDDWVSRIRASMPAYRPAVTPSRGVGVVPECLRTDPDAVRSRHPVVSFAALGDAAVVADHGYDDPLGEGSPLAAIYERDGRVLRLGTGHAANTSLHLAEHRAGVGADRVTNVAPVVVDGERTLVEYEALATRIDDFPEVGAAFERAVGVESGPVGAATATLSRQRALVDFAAEWFAAHR